MATELPETLVSDSTIWLFGRVMDDIILNPKRAKDDVYKLRPKDPNALGRRSPNHFVVDQLLEDDARLARIYAFSFQNELIDLVKPALFVVNGDGVDPQGLEFRSRVAGGSTESVSIFGGAVGGTGLGEMLGTFAAGLKVWAYDRDDFSVRLDMTTGPFDRILLDHELADEGIQGFVRGGAELGRPAPMGGRRRGRGRRWRAEDD
jgi:hypothetical protein